MTDPSPFEALTRRERQIAREIAAGLQLDDIATKLDITKKTVSSHRDRLMKILGTKNNVQLALLAIAERETDCPAICPPRPPPPPPMTNDEIVAEVEAQDFGPLPKRERIR